MIKRFFYIGIVAVSLNLLSCSSVPVRYYTLVAPAEVSVPPSPAAFVIDVLSVGLPEHLEQQQLVVRQSTSGIVVLNNERWASPLSDEIRTALSMQLTRKLAAQDISGLPHLSGIPVLRIKLQVRRFDVWLGQSVQLEADWSLNFSDNTSKRLVCRTQLQEATGGSYPALVKTQQHMLMLLSDQIAKAALQLINRGNIQCPSTAT